VNILNTIARERQEQVKRKLTELNKLIETAPKSFGRKEAAVYSQALKFRSELEEEVQGEIQKHIRKGKGAI